MTVKPAAFIPREMVAKKPPHGQPCTRCGVCCMMTLCPLGQHVFNRVLGPCPALELDADGLSSCGMITNPGKHAPMHTLRAGGAKAASEAAQHMIASGLGCDARINGEPPDEAFYARGREWDRKTSKATKQAKKTWGMR